MVPEAASYRMPFGKHKGKTLQDIADEDPLYLDWAQDELGGEAGDMIREALRDGFIAKLVDDAVLDMDAWR